MCNITPYQRHFQLEKGDDVDKTGLHRRRLRRCELIIPTVHFNAPHDQFKFVLTVYFQNICRPRISTGLTPSAGMANPISLTWTWWLTLRSLWKSTFQEKRFITGNSPAGSLLYDASSPASFSGGLFQDFWSPLVTAHQKMLCSLHCQVYFRFFPLPWSCFKGTWCWYFKIMTRLQNHSLSDYM